MALLLLLSSSQSGESEKNPSKKGEISLNRSAVCENSLLIADCLRLICGENCSQTAASRSIYSPQILALMNLMSDVD
jgi:hypothetical protein